MAAAWRLISHPFANVTISIWRLVIVIYPTFIIASYPFFLGSPPKDLHLRRYQSKRLCLTDTLPGNHHRL